jgi:hypothetical protein
MEDKVFFDIATKWRVMSSDGADAGLEWLE